MKLIKLITLNIIINCYLPTTIWIDGQEALPVGIGNAENARSALSSVKLYAAVQDSTCTNPSHSHSVLSLYHPCTQNKIQSAVLKRPRSDRSLLPLQNSHLHEPDHIPKNNFVLFSYLSASVLGTKPLQIKTDWKVYADFPPWLYLSFRPVEQQTRQPDRKDTASFYSIF